MYYIRSCKNELRAEYREKRRQYPREQREKDAKRMCALFTSLATFRYADVILMYSALPEELDLSPIAHAAWERGKEVAFPRCNSKDCTMTFHFVSSEKELTVGYNGIREPAENAPVYVPGEAGKHAVIIVPALVFDYAGFRIGYGKGYYDRFLAAFKDTSVGFVPKKFLLSDVPHGRYDLGVDFLVTEEGVRTVHAEKQG